jgi:hypothetical protein
VAELTSPRDVHVDALLTNLSLGYNNPSYIADQIAPLVPVMKRSDLIPAYDQSHWFRNLAALRAPGTPSQRGGFTLSNTSYVCNRYSWGFDLIDEVRDNTDSPYNLDRDATFYVTDKLQMNREANFATRYFTTGVWTGDKTGAASGGDFVWFSDYAGSNPIQTITTYIDEVEARIGREPNKLVLGKQVWMQIMNHPRVLERTVYGGTNSVPALINVNAFAAMVGLPSSGILIGRAIHTTSPEGTAEASVVYSRLWGKNALLLYVPETPSLFTPAAMYTFVWNRVPNALQYVKRMRDEEREIDIIEGNTYYDQRITVPRAGLFMASAVQ